ncbi:hypothetical protein IW252_001977 [Zhihengliuella flava]|uniref:Uncharacterized protein n=1 Tax=Zhihengliuella flava TaxID=1285193 RepID=A0A931DA48_9MICC|nr:hypothetical protein [Zhihengliuella flava]MBG6084820.1 hypothetical protein [Zhihengliuella flava]MBG6085210.1 hypothetical protein [Zhihengliuella flava]
MLQFKKSWQIVTQASTGVDTRQPFTK